MKRTLWSIYAEEEGGTFIATQNICSELSRSNKVLHITHVLPKKYFQSVGNLRLLRILILPVLFFFHFLFWTRISKPKKPDYIYTPSTIVAFVFLCFPLLPKTKVVRHFHSFDFGEDDKSLWTYIRAISRGNLFRFAYFTPVLTICYWIEYASFTRSWKIIAPTSYSKALILQRYPSIRENKIVIIPNGIDKKYFYPAQTDTNINSYHVLYVGRFAAEKGIGELLKAFKILNPNKYTLTIISPKFNDHSLLELLTKVLRDKKNILTLSNPYTEIIGKEYQKSDICILPSSLIFEQMPLVYLESLACGIPVIISNKIKGVMDLQRNVSRDLVLPDTRPGTIAAYIQRYCSLTYKQKYYIKQRCLITAKSFSWPHTSSMIMSLFPL